MFIRDKVETRRFFFSGGLVRLCDLSEELYRRRVLVVSMEFGGFDERLFFWFILKLELDSEVGIGKNIVRVKFDF